MPKCGSCGFAHAQKGHCINCGEQDPFRRHRAAKLTLVSVAIVCAVFLTHHLYNRYVHWSMSVREAESAVEAGTPRLSP